MAKINGVQIKALKMFRGHEGEQVAQASVYIDGKKAGFWSQDSWGGPDNYSNCLATIKERAKEFENGCPSSYGEPDIFMWHLLMLTLDEKEFKKYQKEGFQTILIVEDGFHQSITAFRDKMEEDTVLKTYPKIVDNMKKDMYQNVSPKVKVFTEKDFEITVDGAHPAPEYMVS